MYTDVQICNLALRKIGAAPIMALNADTKASEACKEHFPLVRDILIGSHPWNFATKRVSLPLAANKPAYGWDNAYHFPADLIRVLDVGEHPTEEAFTVENRQILCNIPPPLPVRYIFRVPTSAAFPPRFVDAFAFRLAAELAYYLASNASLAEQMIQQADASLARARLHDAQEGTPEQPAEGSWLRSRVAW